MKGGMLFLRKFPKDSAGLYIAYEVYTFDNMFRLLLKSGMCSEEALSFVLANCSLSAVVFQERIHNKQYQKLSAQDALAPDEAARKARLIYDLMEVAGLIH
ncbi:MAG: hypothetical protein ACE5NM_05580 [Sedimentisphaerales bacterium]